MTEEAELQARIAAISGKINQRKQNPSNIATPNPSYSPANHRGPPRWAPYGRGQAIHRNKTLVLAKSTPTANQEHSPGDSQGLVKTKAQMVERSTHQLMTPGTFEREKRRHLQQQSTKLPPNKSAKQPTRELEIEGIRFRMLPNGSKLIRLIDDDLSPESALLITPSKAVISGICFLRTKNGNLIRDNPNARSTHRSAKPQCEHFTKHGIVTNLEHTHRQPKHRTIMAHGQPLGTCPYGPRCKFSHDPTKVAICKDFLRSGSCPRGQMCDLSHDMTYHRVPACTYFLRGNCTNSACRYPHVQVSPAASVCRPFATLGFCAKGPRCEKRHVSECPDYANHGFCADRENDKCLLPHPDHASIMRKVAERQAKLAAGDAFDVSSDEDPDGMDVDSDVADEFAGSDEDSHALSQQQDFVGFS